MALTSTSDALPQVEQHTKPCHDCPWRREALPGWLGGTPPAEWLQAAHSDCVVECHTKTSGHQCAGIAIYRRNVCKNAYPPNLKLPADKAAVFAWPSEFKEHHDVFKKKPVR